MRLSFYIFIILSVIALFIESTYSKSIHLSKKKHYGHKKLRKNDKGKKLEKKDKFYIITVENPYTNTTNTKQKRDLNSLFIDELVSEINTLIVENKDTYENTETLEELDKESVQRKKKRSEQLSEENESNYVFKLSSSDKYTALYAYLSNDLVSKVEEMTNIKACEPELKLEVKQSSYSSYQNEVKKETNWKSVSRRLNSKTHLSLVSQGKYDSAYINSYDDSYYYPETAGSGVDVFIIDMGFNFRGNEFTNISNRCKCYMYVKSGRVIKYEDGKDMCYSDKAKEFPDQAKNHGTAIADAVGGRNHGVASKAKIYGVVIEGDVPLSDLLAVLEVVKSYNSNKKVVVFSYNLIVSPNQRKYSQVIMVEQMVSTIAESAVFVNPAGNDEIPAITDKKQYFPCILDNILCVGGIDNEVNDLVTMNTNSYKKIGMSNYGEGVDVYGPGCIYASYQDYYEQNKSGKECGTSFTTGVAGGIAALIMSEENKSYNSKNMIKKLNTIGIKNAISGLPSGSNNVMLNNGKHVVYSKSSYKDSTCGPSAGNRKCPSGNCCSKYGYCGTTDEHCKSGCQSQFGTCK